MAGNSDSHIGNNGVLPLLCTYIKKESTIEDDTTGSTHSIYSSEIAYPCLTKDYLKSESSFKCENVIEIDNAGLGLVNDFDFESANEPIPGESQPQRNRKDVIADHPPISVKLEATANLSYDFNRNPYGRTEISPPEISPKQIHTNISDFLTANEKSSGFNDDQSMTIIEEDSEMHTVYSKSPIIIKEELIEVDEYTDDTNNHMSSNLALQIGWEETSDSLISPRTNQSEPSSCGNENNLTTLTTNCKEELDLEDVQSITVKEESHNVVEIDMKLEGSMRDNIRKYSKLDNVINCDSTCDNEKQQYMCHTCRHKFPTRRCLIDHLISLHAKFIVYKCRTCELSFYSKAAFFEHSADCHSKSQVNEPNLPLVAMRLTSNNLVNLKNTKTQGYLLTLVYGCSICSRIFKAEISLRNHLEEALSCKKCLKLFCSPTELQIHNKAHDTDISLECLACNRKFKHKISFRCHASRKVTCKNCAESFCFKLDLLKHKQTCRQTYEFPSKYSHEKSVGVKKAESRCEGHNIGKFDCTICRKKFDSKTKLETHSKPKVCETCGEQFCEKIKLWEHKEKLGHWPRSADLISCKLCSKKFGSLQKMRNHLAEHIISCGLCPRKFLSSLDLLNHNKTDHKDELPEKSSKAANTSPKTISCPTKMRNHSAQHSNSGGLSPRKFPKSFGIQNHNKTKHKDKLPEGTLGSKEPNAVSLETIGCTPKMRHHTAEQSNSGGLSPQKSLMSSGHKDKLSKATSDPRGVNATNLETNQTECVTNETSQSHVCTKQSCPDFNLHNRMRKSRLAFLFLCSFCYTRFKSSEELNSHIETKHSIPCPLCPERFSNASDLQHNFYK